MTIYLFVERESTIYLSAVNLLKLGILKRRKISGNKQTWRPDLSKSHYLGTREKKRVKAVFDCVSFPNRKTSQADFNRMESSPVGNRK